MALLLPKERAALAVLKQALGRDFPLVSLSLFGSKARGSSRPDSDIDVLIVLQDCDWETRKRVSALCFDVGLDSGVVISPVIVSRARIDSPAARAAPFYRAMARDGVTV